MADRLPQDDSIPRAADPDVINDELIEVFDTDDESEAMVVKGLLESAGISALITSLDAPQEIFPGVGGVVVRVRREQAEEAANLIAASREAPLQDDAPVPDDPSVSTAGRAVHPTTSQPTASAETPVRPPRK